MSLSARGEASQSRLIASMDSGWGMTLVGTAVFFVGAVVLLSPLLIAMHRDGSFAPLDWASLSFPAFAWNAILQMQSRVEGSSHSWGFIYELPLLFGLIASLLFARWMLWIRSARGKPGPLTTFLLSLVVAVALRLLMPWNSMNS